MEYPGIADMPRENDRTSQRKFTDVYPVQGLSVSLVQGDWLLSPPLREEGLSRTDWMVTISVKKGTVRDGRQVLALILVPWDKDGQR